MNQKKNSRVLRIAYALRLPHFWNRATCSVRSW